jgi:hypothetical protein
MLTKLTENAHLEEDQIFTQRTEIKYNIMSGTSTVLLKPTVSKSYAKFEKKKSRK